MNKIVKRLLTFFIGVPTVIFVVWFDFYHHLLFQLLAMFFCVIGTIELYDMISKKVQLFPKWLILVETLSFPVFTFFYLIFNFNTEYFLWLFIFLVFILLLIETLTKKTFENSIEKISLSTFIIFYLGFMLSFLIKIVILPNSTFFLILYFVLVFMCDSGAWFFGILFGKGSRGYLAASPNKSIVGFIGGIITSTLMGVLAKIFFSDFIPGSIWKIIIVGILTAIGAIIGDLIESVFKRSCDVKDSGRLIPGRGGALDCMDSLLIAAPVFYISIHFLYFV